MSLNEKNSDKKLALPKICFSTKKEKSTAVINEKDFKNKLCTKNQKCSNIFEKSKLNESLKFSNLYLNFKTKNNNLNSFNQNNFKQFPPSCNNTIKRNKNNNYLSTAIKNKQNDFLNSSREIIRTKELQVQNNKKFKIISKLLKYCEAKNDIKINKRNIENISNKFITYYFKKESKKLKNFKNNLKNNKFKPFNQNSFNAPKKLTIDNVLSTNMIVSNEQNNSTINFDFKTFERNSTFNKNLYKNIHPINNNDVKNEKLCFFSTHEIKKNYSPIKKYCKAILMKKESINRNKNNINFRKEEDKDINIISNGRFNNDNE